MNIINALCEYYDQLKMNGLMSSDSLSEENVSAAICINADGEIETIIHLLVESSGKTKKSMPRKMNVPHHNRRSSGINPYFLCDKTQYLLGPCDSNYAGFSSDELKNLKSYQDDVKKFEASKEYHLRILKDVNSEAAEAVKNFFANWNYQDAFSNEDVQNNAKLIGANWVFMYNNQYVHDDSEIQKAWQKEFNTSSEDEVSVFCPVSGENEVLCNLHPGFRGVIGAQDNALLVSYNNKSTESYGLEKGENASIGVDSAMRYGKALNYLLAPKNNHKKVIGDTTVVFWSNSDNDNACNNLMINALFGSGNLNNDTFANDLLAAMSSIAKGRKTIWNEAEIDPSTKFYLLGLAPMKSRLAVKFFHENTLQVFAGNIAKHYERLNIERGKFNRPITSIPMLLAETVNKKESNPPIDRLAANLYYSVLFDRPYPYALISAVQGRVKAERDITYGRAAIIKAYYTKNKNPLCPQEVLTMELNENSTYLPYVLGRLFAVLEDIQTTAIHGLNRTIKDSYFSTAASRPAVVFPTLINLAQKHLSKMDRGLRISKEKKLTAIMGMIEQTYPMHLTVAEQGAYELGYYHETRNRYKKKEVEYRDE